MRGITKRQWRRENSGPILCKVIIDNTCRKGAKQLFKIDTISQAACILRPWYAVLIQQRCGETRQMRQCQRPSHTARNCHPQDVDPCCPPPCISSLQSQSKPQNAIIADGKRTQSSPFDRSRMATDRRPSRARSRTNDAYRRTILRKPPGDLGRPQEARRGERLPAG